MNRLFAIDSWKNYALEDGTATGQTTDPPAQTTTDPAAEPAKALIGDPPKEGEAAKPGEEPKKEEASKAEPLTADAIKFPDNFVVDEPVRDELLGVLNNQELDPKARAQALVDLHVKTMQAASEKGSQMYREMQEGWVKEAEKEFGDKLAPTLGNVSKLIDQFGGDREQTAALRDLFTLTGAGNSPHMVRFLGRIAQELVVEGRPVSPQGVGGERTLASRLYPNQKEG